MAAGCTHAPHSHVILQVLKTSLITLQVLKDHRRGLPISDMLREIVNRGLRTFEGNKNPLGQVNSSCYLRVAAACQQPALNAHRTR